MFIFVLFCFSKDIEESQNHTGEPVEMTTKRWEHFGELNKSLHQHGASQGWVLEEQIVEPG